MDYVWLLMIGQVIWATKVAKNVKIMAVKSFYCISGNFHCSDDSADHQKLKVIQKWAFHILVWYSWLGVCWNATQPWISHQKTKCSFLDYIWLLMIGQVIRAMKVNWNVTKGPVSHQKMKYSFLDYIQLLMISRAIRAMKVSQNVTKGPLSHQKMKYSFLDYI